MPLYIRHSCCVKIPQFRANSTPLTHLRHHYSTHFSIIQKPAIPYFISLFTILTKLFQLFIPVTSLSRILLHKKRPHLAVWPTLLPFSFISKRGNEKYLLWFVYFVNPCLQLFLIYREIIFPPFFTNIIFILQFKCSIISRLPCRSDFVNILF